MRRKETLLGLLAVAALNLIAHFLPFERVSLTPTDMRAFSVPPEERVEYALMHLRTSHRRPLEIAYTLLDWVSGENKGLWVGFLFLTSTLLAAAVYLFYRQLLGGGALPLICALFYVLLPNKEELYWALAFSHLNAVYTFTAASLIFFFLYLQRSRPGWLFASLACYTVTAFWYELGFFLPAVLAVAALLHGNASRPAPGAGGVPGFILAPRLRAVALFLLPAALYLCWRWGLFIGEHAQSIAADTKPSHLWANFSQTVPNLYFGRQMIKWSLYGLIRFPSIEPPWIFLLIAADLLAVAGFLRWLRRNPAPPVPGRALPLAAAMVFFFLLPVAFTPVIKSSHTGLSSIGFSILAVAALRFLIPHRAIFTACLSLLFGAALLICQGTAWNHVVSCRINNAVFETLREEKGAILESERVLLHQHSFAQNIPYTLVKDPLNQLDYYWGVFGLWGKDIRELVQWAVGKPVPVHVIRSPLEPGEERWTFQVYNTDRYQFEEQSVPRTGSVLIDYARVYPNGFHHGKR